MRIRTKIGSVGMVPRLIESLETRHLLAYVSWDGGGDGVNWADPLNWSGDSLPSPADDVGIHTADGGVLMTEDTTINSLFVTDGLLVDGAMLRVMGETALDWTSIRLINGSVLHSSGESLKADGGLIIGAPGDTVPSRLVLSGSFNSFDGEGAISFSAGSVLDLSAVTASAVSVQHNLQINDAIIDAPDGLAFSGGGNSVLRNITTTGPMGFHYMSIAGTITLGGDVSVTGLEVPFGVYSNATLMGNHEVTVFGSDFRGELASNARLTISPETTVRVTASGDLYSFGAGPSILNQGTLVFDGSDADAEDNFRVKVGLTNQGTIEVVGGAKVTIDHLIGKTRMITLSGNSSILNLDGDYEIDEGQTTIGANSTLFLSALSWHRSSLINVNGTVIFDITSSDTTSFLDIKTALISGYHDGSWLGGGICSTESATDTRYTLGYAHSAGIVGNSGTFASVDVDLSAIIVTKTLDADFNLDYMVNFNDLLKLSQSYNTSDRDFVHGDTNFDSIVDFSDLLRASQLYGQSLFSSQLISKSKQRDATSARSVLK